MKRSLKSTAAAALAAVMCLAMPLAVYAEPDTANGFVSSGPGVNLTSDSAAAVTSGSSGGDGIVSAPGSTTVMTDSSQLQETAAVQPAEVTETAAAETAAPEAAAGDSSVSFVGPSGETAAPIQETQAEAAPQTVQAAGQAAASTASSSTQDMINQRPSSGIGHAAIGLPGVAALNADPGGVDIASVVAGAGLEAIGTGNTPPDDILQQVQIVTYQMRDRNGAMMNYAPSNDPGIGLFSADGFSKFYMIHAGVARFYYRTYTDAHGWSPWCTSKEITPYNEDGSRVQAIQIRAKGYVHTFNDVYYKVVLNDGTVLDWAKNGQTTGTMGTDRYIVAIRVGLWHNTESFPYPTKNLMAGTAAYEGTYVDESGRVHYSSWNGQPYTGWGFVDNTQFYFENGEPVSGWKYVDGYKYYFNADGSVCWDLEPIMGKPGAYQINYNKATRSFYVMAADGANGYIIPYKAFNSTCGPDTPLGDFAIYAKYDVKYMHDDVPAAIYCKYLNRFYNGFIIHSILFYGTSLELDAITYNYIDDAASGGCIRLLTGDSYWIYSNCPNGTPVHIYSDQWDKGPIEKGACDLCIPRSQIWDPTDPSSAEAVAALQARAAAEQAHQEAVAAGTAQLSSEEQQLVEQLAASAQ